MMAMQIYNVVVTVAFSVPNFDASGTQTVTYYNPGDVVQQILWDAEAQPDLTPPATCEFQLANPTSP